MEFFSPAVRRSAENIATLRAKRSWENVRSNSRRAAIYTKLVVERVDEIWRFMISASLLGQLKDGGKNV